MFEKIRLTLRVVFSCIFIVIVLSGANAFAEDDDEKKKPKVDCKKEPEKCLTTTGTPVNPPNSNPTPHTGGNIPENSTNVGEGEPGYIDYEEDFKEFSCEALLDGYDDANLFQQIHMSRSYSQCVQGQVTMAAICKVLDMDDVIDQAGSIGGCAAACTKGIKGKHGGFIAACTTLCVASINQGQTLCP